MFALFVVILFVTALGAENQNGEFINSDDQTYGFSEFNSEELEDFENSESRNDDSNSLEQGMKQFKISEDLRQELPLLAQGSIRDRAGLTANVNNYVDKILADARGFMVRSDMDSVLIPDEVKGFSKKILFITYSGSIKLTKGSLKHISTISRGGDTIVTYKPSQKKIYIDVPVAFGQIEFNYHYSVKFMGLGPTGGIDGKLSKAKVIVRITVDLDTYEASVDKCEVTNSGFVSITYSGNILTDWLADLFTDVISIFLRGVVLDIINGVIKDGADIIVTEINHLIQQILNPPVFQTDSLVAAILNKINQS